MSEPLILTRQMQVDAIAYDMDQRLDARKLLRPLRQAAARQGVRTRRRS